MHVEVSFAGYCMSSTVADPGGGGYMGCYCTPGPLGLDTEAESAISLLHWNDAAA